MLEVSTSNSMGEMATAIYAAIAGFIVGGVIKFFNAIANRDKFELEAHLALRKELREELDSVKEELQRLEDELDEWKQKYYNQVELTNELKLSIVSLSEELTDYKKSYEKLINNYPNEIDT